MKEMSIKRILNGSSSLNDVKKMKNQPNIIGFPTIKCYDNGKELSEHNGERTCQPQQE